MIAQEVQSQYEAISADDFLPLFTYVLVSFSNLREGFENLSNQTLLARNRSRRACRSCCW